MLISLKHVEIETKNRNINMWISNEKSRDKNHFFLMKVINSCIIIYLQEIVNRIRNDYSPCISFLIFSILFFNSLDSTISRDILS